MQHYITDSLKHHNPNTLALQHCTCYFRIETMTAHNLSRLSRDDMAACTLVRKTGADVIHKAVVPMWIFYQFMISVVLLRILIVMLTITYKKIYDNMDTQWKYDNIVFI